MYITNNSNSMICLVPDLSFPYVYCIYILHNYLFTENEESSVIHNFNFVY